MMYRFIHYLITLWLTLALSACVEPTNFSDNYTNGYWIRYSSITGDTFFSDNLQQAMFVAKIEQYYGSQPSKLELYVKFANKEYLVKQLLWGADTIKVSPQEIAKGIYGSSGNLDSFIKAFPAGSIINLVYYPYDKNGNKVYTETAYGLGSATSYQNLNNKFTISIFCPFIIDEIVGTYIVTKDDNQDGVNEVSITKINDTIYQVNGYPSPKYDINGTGKLFQVVVNNNNQRTGACRIVPYPNYGRYVANGAMYSIRGGSGFTYSCVGLLNFNMIFATSATTAVTTKALAFKRK